MYQSLLRLTLVLLSLAVAGCGHSDSDPRTLPPLVRVATAGQAGGTTREFTGVVAARVQSDLAFRVGGKVTSRLVRPDRPFGAGKR